MKGYNAGLKIRASAMHQSAATRNVLILSHLAISPEACGCTKMQETEANAALDPALTSLLNGNRLHQIWTRASLARHIGWPSLMPNAS